MAGADEQRDTDSPAPPRAERTRRTERADEPVAEPVAIGEVGAEDIGFAPWDGRRVPVTLLGGYLGAGKTTVINELLARTTRPIAVLVNDVGQVNVDAALIKRRHGDTIELTDGCVCCSISQGLVEAFENLRRRSTPPDQVVLELSGVADPARVVPFANSDGFRLDGVVVLVDCDQFLERLDQPISGASIRAQLAGADVLLLTKTDLVDKPRVDLVKGKLAELTDDRPVLDRAGPLAAAGFLNTGTRHPRSFAATPNPSLFDAHQTEIKSLPDPVNHETLQAIIDELGPEVLRAKGIARTPDGETHLVQVVGPRRLITPLPVAEDQPPTDLVIISAPS